MDDAEVESWIGGLGGNNGIGERSSSLFAYPGQSNMTGHRPPLDWCRRLRDATSSSSGPVYTLYDVASLLSTSPLDLSDASLAPDFTALSFYKIFGFPDLGALIVRKASGAVLRQRKYFGGGTVDMVTTAGTQWHAKKDSSLHSRLEDGTLPFHNIIALQSALEIHQRLYGPMRNVSRHCEFLASRLRCDLIALRHANGLPVCKIYNMDSISAQPTAQGPIVAFNLLDSHAAYVPKSEVEKLSVVKNIQLRTGGLCNPGGIARHIGLSPEDMRRNFASGQRCGDDNDILDGKPTGAIRVSLGAMSSLKDVERFVEFVKEFYVERDPVVAVGTTLPPAGHIGHPPPAPTVAPTFIIESLSVYPIKSCAAFRIPPNIAWEIREKGLAWDRQWCLVHQGTGAALSQKKHPRMTLLKPTIDLQNRVLRVEAEIADMSQRKLEISLEERAIVCVPDTPGACDAYTSRESSVCGSTVAMQIYTAPHIAAFFTEALGAPCTLARLPDRASRRVQARMPIPLPAGLPARVPRPINLANESPVLLVSRSSVNRLNEQIKQNSTRISSSGSSIGRAVPADAFRGNIVVAEELAPGSGYGESPYVEDGWTNIRIGGGQSGRGKGSHDGGGVGVELEVLGPCQRCQMVCVDQTSAQRRQEPFSTLAKTRKREGRVWFGMHLCLLGASGWVRVGDQVWGS